MKSVSRSSAVATGSPAGSGATAREWATSNILFAGLFMGCMVVRIGELRIGPRAKDPRPHALPGECSAASARADRIRPEDSTNFGLSVRTGGVRSVDRFSTRRPAQRRPEDWTDAL